jgi:hypothetical protein
MDEMKSRPSVAVIDVLPSDIAQCSPRKILEQGGWCGASVIRDFGTALRGVKPKAHNKKHELSRDNAGESYRHERWRYPAVSLHRLHASCPTAINTAIQ